MKKNAKIRIIFSYPSSPALTSLEDNVTHPSTNDVIDGLSCDLFINLSFQDEVGAEEKDLAVESFGLQNPWNSKVLGDALLKFKSHNSVSEVVFFCFFYWPELALMNID